MASAWRIGSAKAAVLPLPVSAAPMAFMPRMIGGMHARCTGVGCTKPSDLQHWINQ